ncbi:dolichyldiphosphatase [Ranunculus cassubicifolius]
MSTITDRRSPSLYQVAQNQLHKNTSKWLVAGIFVVAILWKHDAEVLWASMGCVLNSYLSIVLKKVINQERPSTLGSGPGMPSSHAQSIFFAVVYAILSMVKCWGLNEYTITVAVLAFAFSSYLSWLRVSLRHHTISQISVGAVIGTIMSILWFHTWYGVVLSAFIANLWVRIVVVLGSAAVCVGFGLYVILHWLNEDQ